jgi:hypothetical protein
VACGGISPILGEAITEADSGFLLMRAKLLLTRAIVFTAPLQ